MSTTIVHLSDLHYQIDRPEGVNRVLDVFLSDLKAVLQGHQNIYMAFTGDFAWDADFPGVYKEIGKYITRICNETGIPIAHRLCVPGNHDVSQSSVKKVLVPRIASINALLNEDVFNDNFNHLSETYFASELKEYRLFEQEFFGLGACGHSVAGQGYHLGNDVSVFCLNSSLCTATALDDTHGRKIFDKGLLHVETRGLYHWLNDCKSPFKILLMHHPFDWLSSWAQAELSRLALSDFSIVLCGHTHKGTVDYHATMGGRTVLITSPALFTSKAGPVGYSVITLSHAESTVDVEYRQWIPSGKFVRGTALAGNDAGVVKYRLGEIEQCSSSPLQSALYSDTKQHLGAEFEDALTGFSNKTKLWTERILSRFPETSPGFTKFERTPLECFLKNVSSCVLRAPKQHGLTCVGRRIALMRFVHNGDLFLYLEMVKDLSHRQGFLKVVQERCSELKVETERVFGYIIDNWSNDEASKKTLKVIQQVAPQAKVILLYGCDDCADVSRAIDLDSMVFPVFYLASLDRNGIRDIVAQYAIDVPLLKDDDATTKIIADIDALNIHRTPLNCLMLLRLVEHEFDDSPVNRTDLVGRVLYLLFLNYDQIPRYATRPDLKDCEYALGYFCEHLIRSHTSSFTKDKFCEIVKEYCEQKLVELDADVLFSFLYNEKIFIRRGILFSFRFAYWLFYFAAHRMYHESTFANYVWQERRYAVLPELIEFYAGIDRRRDDAINKLSEDLRLMNDDFETRTGIEPNFNPYSLARWMPDPLAIEQIQSMVEREVAESTLPEVVKDDIADRSYDRSKPYRQEIADFIERSTVLQMVQAMRGAARALRNSDHASPAIKVALLDEIIRCWVHVCQVLVVLSPILAKHQAAGFEDMVFILDESYESYKREEERYCVLMDSLLYNIVSWYHEDLHSRKMGQLLAKYSKLKEGGIEEALVMLIMIQQRPNPWHDILEQYIVRSSKNSYYLMKIAECLYYEYKIGFTSERHRQQLRNLWAMAIAKHSTGQKKPNLKMVRKVAAVIDAPHKT